MFTKQVMVHKKALVGCLKIVYWLDKEETPNMTKYDSLKCLAIFLGCDYMKEICVGIPVTAVEQTIAELLQCLSSAIKENTFSELRSSTFS